MKHKIPQFWYKKTIISWLLLPGSWLYIMLTAHAAKKAEPYGSKVPILCIGNVTVGGAGKTPTVIALATALEKKGKRVVIVSKGYGGAIKKPTQVSEEHTAYDVGDEALLLCKAATTVVGYVRKQAIKYAETLNPDIIIMDDGMQNNTIKKDMSILVVDALFGIGNGRVLLAGPMRETMKSAMKKAGAVLWIGEKGHHKELQESIRKRNKAIIYATIKPLHAKKQYNAGKYIAFAGIGNPDKFFNTLQKYDITLSDKVTFPDHHVYTGKEIEDLINKAKEQDAKLITTEKDMVKIKEKYRKHIKVFPITLEIESDTLLKEIINKITV